MWVFSFFQKSTSLRDHDSGRSNPLQDSTFIHETDATQNGISPLQSSKYSWGAPLQSSKYSWGTSPMTRNEVDFWK